MSMEKQHLVFFAIGLLLSPFMLLADEPTHIEISGRNGDRQLFDLMSFNRITFGENSMKLSRSEAPDFNAPELLYSQFNRIAFISEVLSDVDEEISTGIAICYIAEDKALEIIGEEYEDFDIKIYNALGLLIQHTKSATNERIYLNNLTSGVFIAIATNGRNNLRVKFIVK